MRLRWINFINMTTIKSNVNGIRFGFKKMKLRASNVSLHIVIGVNLSVTRSQFGFPDIKFDVWRSKFYFCQIEGVVTF